MEELLCQDTLRLSLAANPVNVDARKCNVQGLVRATTFKSLTIHLDVLNAHVFVLKLIVMHHVEEKDLELLLMTQMGVQYVMDALSLIHI